MTPTGNHVGNDVLDATACRVPDPPVDPLGRRSVREIEFRRLGAEGLPHGVQEVRVHRDAATGPHGVADRRLDGGIEADQELEQGLVGGVDFFLGEAPEPEHVAHLFPGLPVRPVHGHPERHGRRERRQEEIVAGSVGLREEVEREPIARPDDLDLPRGEGAWKLGDILQVRFKQSAPGRGQQERQEKGCRNGKPAGYARRCGRGSVGFRC